MSPMKNRASAASVMVVDDNPANLKLMSDMLGQQGYDVRLFPRGRMAIASASQRPPDLVLLDINMPEMDGYQVCRQFKADAQLADIPVIFLSALREPQDKVKGLSCGGVDFISKPFQLEEVQARVETHLKIHQLQRDLQLQNERLEETVAARTRELQDAHARLTILDEAKSEFLQLISHELRTPLNGLIGVGDLLLDGVPQTEENRELFSMFQTSRRRMLSIIDDALLLTKIGVEGEGLPAGPAQLTPVFDRALQACVAIAGDRGVRLFPEEFVACAVRGSENFLFTALKALIEAAIGCAAPRGVVRFRQQLHGDRALVVMETPNTTVPATLIGRFFEAFAASESSLAGVNLGLRPAVAYRILALSGGSASVENIDEVGVRFTAEFSRLS